MVVVLPLVLLLMLLLGRGGGAATHVEACLLSSVCCGCDYNVAKTLEYTCCEYTFIYGCLT